MPTEDHHNNTTVEVYACTYSICTFAYVVMVTQDDQPQKDTNLVNKPSLSENVS